MVYIAYGMVWIAVSIAVCIAIWVTKSAVPLWALAIPLLISISFDKEE